MKIQDITFEKCKQGFGGSSYELVKSGRVYSVNTCADMRLWVRRASNIRLAEISQICQTCPGCDRGGDCPLIERIIDSWI